MGDPAGSATAIGQGAWLALCSATRRRSRCPADAEDAVQEGCLRLLEAERRATGPGPLPLGYLARVVRNLAVDQRRRRRIEARLFIVAGLPGDEPVDRCSPEALATEREMLDRLRAALDELPARTRAAFELHRLGGLDQATIAARLGISRSLAHRLVKDALTHCREALDRATVRGSDPGRRVDG